MLGRKLISTLARTSQTNKFSSFSTSAEKGKSKTLSRKVVPIVLISVTGGVALSALNDLAIFHSCSSKAIERARENKAIIDALGEPIERGPWYNATLAVAQSRRSVSCTFPVSGPQGTGIIQLKAIRPGDDDKWFSFLRSRNWEILIMDALLHVPSNEEKDQTMRISLTDYVSTPVPSKECIDCKSPEQGRPERS